MNKLGKCGKEYQQLILFKKKLTGKERKDDCKKFEKKIQQLFLIY